MQPFHVRDGHAHGRSWVSAAEDQADVERVQAGDVSAFESIVRRWQGPLVSLAYRFCLDRGRAEEMAQGAFLRAYGSLGKWRRESASSTGLFALATDLYCSEVRRIPPNTVSLDGMAEIRELRATDRGLLEDERDRIVREAVLALPARYREAIILYYFYGMDIAAAARSLRLPDGTVKARMSRGRNIRRHKPTKILGAFGLEHAR